MILRRALLLLPLLVLVSACAQAAGGESAGRKLFTEKTCVTCHNMGATSAGLGPELTQVGWHRDSSWIATWLTDPPKVKKDTAMPKLDWKSPAEMRTVIEFLLASRRPIPAADSSSGSKLFDDFKCGACHALNHKGGKPQFPDLGLVGRKRAAPWLDRWLANPQAVKKGTFEPTFPLSSVQRKAMVDYLLSLK